MIKLKVKNNAMLRSKYYLPGPRSLSLGKLFVSGSCCLVRAELEGIKVPYWVARHEVGDWLQKQKARFAAGFLDFRSFVTKLIR